MIENSKDIEKIIKLARKHGVLEIKLGDFAIKLSETPPPKVHKYAKSEKSEPETPQLTDEDMLFWSVNQIGAQ